MTKITDDAEYPRVYVAELGQLARGGSMSMYVVLAKGAIPAFYSPKLAPYGPHQSNIYTSEQELLWYHYRLSGLSPTTDPYSLRMRLSPVSLNSQERWQWVSVESQECGA